MELLDDLLDGVKTVGIAGHENPDADCIGSTMAAWLYLRDNYPEIKATVYLGSYRDVFLYIEGLDQAKDTCGPEEKVDLMILTDISSKSRIGVAGPLAERTEKVVCYDHHVTNTGSYTWFYNRPDASSACEVLFDHMDPEKISPACATALYTGIVNDTGIFQYSSTTPDTMRKAAALMEKGVPFSQIIDKTFFQKSYAQNKIMGRILTESRLYYGGGLVLGSVSLQEITAAGLQPKDMDGFINELRNTSCTKAAVFLYEREPDVWKVSMRSRETLDVSIVAKEFGGGGHVRAAGCNISGKEPEIEEKVVRAFAEFF